MTNKHYCVNCGKLAKQRHHIVPRVLGGTNRESNLAWLCDQCHDAVHGLLRYDGSISHSELIKQGLREARKRGSQIGRRKIIIEDIPENFFYQYNLYIDKKTNITNISKELHMSRTTVYRYIELIKLQKGHE